MTLNKCSICMRVLSEESRCDSLCICSICKKNGIESSPLEAYYVIIVLCAYTIFAIIYNVQEYLSIWIPYVFCGVFYFAKMSYVLINRAINIKRSSVPTIADNIQSDGEKEKHDI